MSKQSNKHFCKNCGDPTKFGPDAYNERVAPGWCAECYRQSKRDYVDKETGIKHWHDDDKTIDWQSYKWVKK